MNKPDFVMCNIETLEDGSYFLAKVEEQEELCLFQKVKALPKITETGYYLAVNTDNGEIYRLVTGTGVAAVRVSISITRTTDKQVDSEV